MSMKNKKICGTLSPKEAETVLEEIIKQGAIQARQQQEAYEDKSPKLSAEDKAYLKGKIDAQINRNRRKHRTIIRTIVVAAALVCMMAAITIGGGALNEYINKLSPEHDSKGVGVNIEKENIITTFDGKTIEEHYQEVLQKAPGFVLVVPTKLPQSSQLKFIDINGESNHIRMLYELPAGILTMREYRTGDAETAVEYKVLENNKVETSDVVVMDYPAQYMEVTLESGDKRHIVTWADQTRGSYYIEFSGDKATFNMILDGLKIFEKK